MRDAARRTGPPRRAMRVTPASSPEPSKKHRYLREAAAVAGGLRAVQRSCVACGGASASVVWCQCRRCVARGAAARPGRQSLAASGRRGSLLPTQCSLHRGLLSRYRQINK
ncbi:hypothetical protein KGM_214133 [Danaus plexippus plexippus]|uniref:Uncharacterized protein n=1 Tax=Danaus plexippus plexippus TaxID=278856 RepID=A0A212F616_DANPL|nr:hypothetical protein KGM_214133 [Danaus plexippus plexippus]